MHSLSSKRQRETFPGLPISLHLFSHPHCYSKQLLFHEAKYNTSLRVSSQGERGLDGPRGPRGQPGAGIKGAKVQSAEKL